MNEASEKTSTGLDQNIAGLLCYLGWWVTGIIFLVIEKDNKFVRFHAMQSIVVFVILMIASILFNLIPFVGWLLWVVSVVVWIFLMYKAYKGEMYKVFFAGNFAEKLLQKK